MLRSTGLLHRRYGITVMAASPSVAASHVSRHSEIKLLRLNAEYVDAIRTADADWLERHLAEDFRCILPTGDVVDRNLFMSRPLEAAVSAAFADEDVSVHFEGDTAIVRGRAVSRRPDGSECRSDFTHVWVGRDGRWQTLTTQITSDPAQ